jgi:glutamine amidotransferase
MARLFGYFANQSDRIRCAVTREGDGLRIDEGTRVDGWGVGSYQGGEVLLRKRPAEQREQVNLFDLVRDLRTDTALVHVRSATVGARSLDNTHPFRFRQWLFAHTGSVPGFNAVREDLCARLPDFLARNVRGETDSEVLFATFLSFVWETGRLDDPEVDRRVMSQALKQTVEAVDAISEKHAQEKAALNCVVTNHHAMVGLRRGLAMSWVKRTGIRDCEVCRKQPDISGREPKRVDHEALRYVIIASAHAAMPNDWFEVPASPRGAVVAVDRSLDAQVVEL